MRTLAEIVADTRAGSHVAVDELRAAVVAFDVLTAKLSHQNNAIVNDEMGTAFVTDPVEYSGPYNMPGPEYDEFDNMMCDVVRLIRSEVTDGSPVG